jgi:cytochrome c6
MNRIAAGLTAAVLASTQAAGADPQRGAELYRSHCMGCHGAGGKPVLPGAPDFTQLMALLKPDIALLASIRQGRGAMPAYAGQLRDREILDLVSHLRTFR